MLRFGVLGPLEVWSEDNSPVRVAEPKVRALLADLLAHGGGPISADRLIDDLWGARPGRNPVGTLQARVSQLRRSLGDPGSVVRDPAGYRLARADSDALRFQSLVERRSPSLRQRAAELEEALRLWRGSAYADFADAGFARAEAARLEEARLAALEEQAEVRLELGEPVDLGDLVARHPLRERLVASHMKALYRGGRQSEALAAYGELRRRLGEELGLDPSPALTELHQAVLRQDPSLTPRDQAHGSPTGTPAPRTNLPAPLTELIGRQAELAEVRALLTTSRLVTLTGPGGVGKTRLALAAASEAASDAADFPDGGWPDGVWPDGVWLVELAGAVDVAETVAATLGVRDDSADALAPRLAGALAGKRMLLVLDNCEHLVEQVAELVSALLRAAPGLRVLATSQEPLGVTGEHVRVVPPLPEPEAVRLFTARANVEPSETVATVCRRLDGIPLALELAATRVRALGVKELADRLDDRFRLLSAGTRDAPARQRTLRAMIDWSWELLSEPERVVLRRLAVHADGCTLDAAEEVCAEPGVDVLDTLARLVDRSLVVRVPGPRFRLLESVTAYCVERLREAGEHEAIRERHARYYTALASRADLRGPGQREWLARLDAESANLRLAVAGPEPLRLVNALAWYWVLRGRLHEARRSLATALATQGPPTPPSATTDVAPAITTTAATAGLAAAATGLSAMSGASPTCANAATGSEAVATGTGTGGIATSAEVGVEAVGAAGMSAFPSGEAAPSAAVSSGAVPSGAVPSGVAVEAARASVWLAGIELLIGGPASSVRRADLDPAGVALADWFLSHVRWAYGDRQAHEAAAERALAAYRKSGDRWGVAAALCLRGKLAVGRGDLAAMERDGERGLEIFGELGDAWGQMEAMDVLDRAAEIRGDYAKAARLREEALRLAEELGFEVSFRLAALGRIAMLSGDYERADDYHERARRVAVEQSYKSAEENAVLGLAMSARRQGRHEQAESYLLSLLDWLRQVRGTPGIAFVMAELGFAAEQRGAAATALARHREGYEAARATADPRAVALALEGLAGALSLTADHRSETSLEAARLIGAATAIRKAVGAPLPPGERLDVERISRRLRAVLGDEGFERALREGELGDHFPGALGGGARVESAAQRLHPLRHPDQPEPAAEAGDARI
ncbi:BTAD domain-containing putative transcriptional regulator [Nonomuraea sp. NPDC049695]|uniref:BTAD domain-containing putative transcriptional regulator n=1 Tax=Nonomuraea sp. NPDC049695 TaxID=3154734 RepID=UPI003419F906